jgi:flagellar biosynthesis GTPase FlhF
VEDRNRFLIKVFVIEAVILIAAYIAVASIQPEEARQPEQHLGRSGDSQIKAAPTTASGIAGASSSGAQSQREERLPLEAEKKRQEEAAAKNEAERLALEAEKKRQEEAAKKEADRLALEAEKKLQEVAGKDAERLALAAEKKRQQELAAPSPNAAGKAQATARTDQQIVVPNIVGPPSAPETTFGPAVTGTQKPQVTAVQGGAASAVSADLPIFAPSRVVLTYPRNDKAAAERTTALRQALTAAKVEVVKVEAVDASRPTPGIGYYFRSDHDAAVDVSHRVQPLLGPVEPALLELRGKVPPPGTVEIAVPGRGAR